MYQLIQAKTAPSPISLARGGGTDSRRWEPFCPNWLVYSPPAAADHSGSMLPLKKISARNETVTCFVTSYFLGLAYVYRINIAKVLARRGATYGPKWWTFSTQRPKIGSTATFVEILKLAWKILLHRYWSNCIYYRVWGIYTTRTARSSECTVGESRMSAVNTWSCCLRTYSNTTQRIQGQTHVDHHHQQHYHHHHHHHRHTKSQWHNIYESMIFCLSSKTTTLTAAGLQHQFKMNQRKWETDRPIWIYGDLH